MRIPVALLLVAVIGCGQTPPPQPQKPEKPLSVEMTKKALADLSALDKEVHNKLKADQDRELAVAVIMGLPGQMLSPGARLWAQWHVEKQLINLKIYIAQYELVLQLSETPEQFKHYRQECQKRLQEWHQWEAEQTHLDIQKVQDAPEASNNKGTHINESKFHRADMEPPLPEGMYPVPSSSGAGPMPAMVGA